MIKQIAVPNRLQTIDQPPKNLYYEGDVSLLEKPLIAIVGTRRPSSYAKTWTKRIAAAIAEAGGVVVSGGAFGVDLAAHEAAFPNTIAVLAGSIDTDDRDHIARFKKEALVLSEYEREIAPRDWSFVHRNRLITGLAAAVCVMEANLKSGSSSSLDRAIAQNRPLWTIPHRLGESEATNRAAAEGKARLIWSEEALLAALNLAAPDKPRDEFLDYALTRPLYEEAIERFGGAVFEYELGGKITVVEGRIEVLNGDARA